MTRLRWILALVLVPYLALAGGTTSPSGGGGGGTSTPNFSNIVDDILCGGLQVTRRNAGDNAWECIAAPGGGDALKADTVAQFAAIDSATFDLEISDDTGSGPLVFQNGAVLIAPQLGTPASGVMTNVTGTAEGLTAGFAAHFDNIIGDIGCTDLVCSITDNSIDITKLEPGVQGDIIQFSTGGGVWTKRPTGTSGQMARVNTSGLLEYVTFNERECFPLYAPNAGVQATDDVKSVWRAPVAVTITDVWCETDQGTVSMDLEIDDGSPAKVMGADLVCNTTGINDGAGLSGSMAANDRLDFSITSVGGAPGPTRVTACIQYTR